MLAKDLLSDVVPTLKTSDSGMKALHWMDIFRISHLPIVNEKEFLGLISDKDIYDLNSATEPIGNHTLSLLSPFVFESQHIYEVIALASSLKLSLVPVLDEHNNFLGVITMEDIIKHMADMMALKQPGGILILELNENDYSLSQIAQIVEGNDAKILSLYIYEHPNSMKIELLLKINRIDLSSIIQTFIRYNYTIKGSFMKDDNMDSVYENRYESFMRYLNI